MLKLLNINSHSTSVCCACPILIKYIPPSSADPCLKGEVWAIVMVVVGGVYEHVLGKAREGR